MSEMEVNMEETDSGVFPKVRIFGKRKQGSKTGQRRRSQAAGKTQGKLHPTLKSVLK